MSRRAGAGTSICLLRLRNCKFALLVRWSEGDFRSMIRLVIKEAGRGDSEFFCESFDGVERRRIGRAFKKANIVAVDSGTMRQFLLRKPTGVTHSP